MSLKLNQGTKPNELNVKTLGLGADVVLIGEYEVSIQDFFAMAHYVLTNTNLLAGDPRRQFVASVKAMEEVEGYPSFGFGGKPAPPGKRLYTKVAPYIDPKEVKH